MNLGGKQSQHWLVTIRGSSFWQSWGLWLEWWWHWEPLRLVNGFQESLGEITHWAVTRTPVTIGNLTPGIMGLPGWTPAQGNQEKGHCPGSAGQRTSESSSVATRQVLQWTLGRDGQF